MSRLRNSLLAALLCPLFCTGQLLALACDVGDRPAKACSSEDKTVEIASTESHEEAIDDAVAKTPPSPPPDAGNPSRNAIGAVADSLGGTANGLMRFLGGTVNGLVRSVEGTANGLGRSVGGTVGGLVRSVEGTANGLGRSVGGTVDGFGRSLEGTVDGLGQFLDDSGEVALEVAEGAAAVAIVAGVLFLYVMAESHCYHGHGYYH